MAAARDRFESALRTELIKARRRSLEAAVGADSTLGDLLGCLDDGAYLLADDDPITVGDLLGQPGAGPRIVSVLQQRELPLDSPLDVASTADLSMPLSQLLAAGEG